MLNFCQGKITLLHYFNSIMGNACFNLKLDQIEMLVRCIQYIRGDFLSNDWSVQHLVWTFTYLKTYSTYENI